jgi:hypothetical protein
LRPLPPPRPLGGATGGGAGLEIWIVRVVDAALPAPAVALIVTV